jgi:spermidine synthase
VGQNDPAPIDLDVIDEKLSRAEYSTVAQSLVEVGFYSSAQLMSTFVARKPEIDPWLADAQINRDRNLRLQFLAGMGVNLYEADQIYRDMARYRTFPEGLFTGSPRAMGQLLRAWETGG